MKLATSRLNRYALLIEDAQTEIREIIKVAFLLSVAKPLVERKVNTVIVRTVKQIKIPRLASDSKQSLFNFATRQYALWLSLALPIATIKALGKEASKGFTYKAKPTTRVEREIIESVRKSSLSIEKPLVGEISPSYIIDSKGVPLSKFYKEVWDKGVKPTLNRLMSEVALDPNDYTGRNSLRNLAEMEVRYNEHLENIADLKAKGVRLVIASSHADCSDRCAKWQGRVYSLDGSYGVTEDGRKYVPLEVATNVYYTTKAGRTYKNGLLGFNCRHKLYEYKVGMRTPTVSAKERKKEYEITKKQRELERAVRKKKVEALMLKDINEKGYKEAQREATVLYNKYKAYCHKNKRAYYPMRVAI